MLHEFCILMAVKIRMLGRSARQAIYLTGFITLQTVLAFAVMGMLNIPYELMIVWTAGSGTPAADVPAGGCPVCFPYTSLTIGPGEVPVWICNEDTPRMSGAAVS